MYSSSFFAIMNFYYYLIDNGQLKPLTNVHNKTTITDSIFDLPISQRMQRFTIREQYRCNNLYHTFLGISPSLIVQTISGTPTLIT